MKINEINKIPLKRLTIFKVGFLFFLINGFIANGQSISKVQDLNFGDFIPYGQGGTLSVSPDGILKYTGEIIPKSIPTPASFDLNLATGKTVKMTYDNNVTLKGNHGGMITFIPADSSPTGNGLIITGLSPTRITFGGTLNIGSNTANPVGLYSGFLVVSITVNN